MSFIIAPPGYVATVRDDRILLSLVCWFLLISAFIDATLYYFKVEEGTVTGISLLRLVAYGVVVVRLMQTGLFRVLIDRTGKGLRSSPRDALLAESVPANLRGAAFGWHRLMDTLGAAVGPLLAISLLSIDTHELRQLYFWAVIPGLVAVLITLSVRESKPVSQPVATGKSRWSWRTSSKSFKTYLGAWAVFSAANSSDVFLLLKAKHAGIDLKVTILMYCFYNLTYAITSPYLGHVSDRLGRKGILISGLMVFALVYLGFTQATTQVHYWALFGVYGLYMAATDGVGKAFVIDLVPSTLKATALGMLGAVTGIATLVASSAAGLLWDHLGATAPFYYGAVGALVAAAILGFMKTEERHAPMAHG